MFIVGVFFNLTLTLTYPFAYKLLIVRHATHSFLKRIFNQLSFDLLIRDHLNLNDSSIWKYVRIIPRLNQFQISSNPNTGQRKKIKNVKLIHHFFFYYIPVETFFFNYKKLKQKTINIFFHYPSYHQQQNFHIRRDHLASFNPHPKLQILTFHSV